jgi:hypothetical protein
MALITIEGVYENGKVELAESPEGVERANVMVTFLPDVNAGRIKSVRKDRNSPVQGEAALMEGERYPKALQDEYEALIRKKLHRIMTPEEEVRLENVRTEINRRDRQSHSWSVWEQRAAEIDGDIADLRRELEALPDA